MSDRENHTAAELATDLERLALARASHDFEALVALAVRLEARWRDQGDARAYSTVVTRACDLLSSAPAEDLARRSAQTAGLAGRALRSELERPFDAEVELLRHLTSHQPAEEMRAERAGWWLRALRRFETETDATFDPDAVPVLQSPQLDPLSSGLPNQPTEEPAAEQEAVASRYRHQQWLRRESPIFTDQAVAAIARLYGATAAERASLEALFEHHQTTPAHRERILHAQTSGAP